jgi:hypothetical protein
VIFPLVGAPAQAGHSLFAALHPLCDHLSDAHISLSFRFSYARAVPARLQCLFRIRPVNQTHEDLFFKNVNISCSKSRWQIVFAFFPNSTGKIFLPERPVSSVFFVFTGVDS